MALVRVRYKGLPDVRIMSKRDLADVGVSVDGDLVWDSVGKARGGVLKGRNDLTGVFIEDPSDELLTLLKQEGTFTVEEVDAETRETVQTVVRGSAIDDTGQEVVDKSATATTSRTGRGSST
jgi:hypothetical protein